MEALFRAADVSLEAVATDGSTRTAAYFDETLPLRLSVRLPSSVDAVTARTILESPALSLSVDLGYVERIVDGGARPSLMISVGQASSPAIPRTPAPVPTALSHADEPYAHVQPTASSSQTIGATELRRTVGEDGRGVVGLFELDGVVGACSSGNLD